MTEVLIKDGRALKHVQVREHEDGAVRIYLGDVELAARPFPKDNRVSQGAIVSNKLLAGALTVIQRSSHRARAPGFSVEDTRFEICPRSARGGQPTVGVAR